MRQLLRLILLTDALIIRLLLYLKNDNCYGGASRLYTRVKNITENTDENIIFLNAGDYYQGKNLRPKVCCFLEFKAQDLLLFRI